MSRIFIIIDRLRCFFFLSHIFTCENLSIWFDRQFIIGDAEGNFSVLLFTNMLLVVVLESFEFLLQYFVCVIHYMLLVMRQVFFSLSLSQVAFLEVMCLRLQEDSMFSLQSTFMCFVSFSEQTKYFRMQH